LDQIKVIFESYFKVYVTNL